VVEHHWVCPFCGQAQKMELDVLTHMKEAHAAIFKQFPNPLVPKENLFMTVG